MNIIDYSKSNKINSHTLRRCIWIFSRDLCLQFGCFCEVRMVPSWHYHDRHLLHSIFFFFSFRCFCWQVISFFPGFLFWFYPCFSPYFYPCFSPCFYPCFFRCFSPYFLKNCQLFHPSLVKKRCCFFVEIHWFEYSSLLFLWFFFKLFLFQVFQDFLMMTFFCLSSNHSWFICTVNLFLF